MNSTPDNMPMVGWNWESVRDCGPFIRGDGTHDVSKGRLCDLCGHRIRFGHWLSHFGWPSDIIVGRTCALSAAELGAKELVAGTGGMSRKPDRTLEEWEMVATQQAERQLKLEMDSLLIQKARCPGTDRTVDRILGMWRHQELMCEGMESWFEWLSRDWLQEWYRGRRHPNHFTKKVTFGLIPLSVTVFNYGHARYKFIANIPQQTIRSMPYPDAKVAVEEALDEIGIQIMRKVHDQDDHYKDLILRRAFFQAVQSPDHTYGLRELARAGLVIPTPD